MAVAQKVDENITEQESLNFTRNLLRISIFNISYIRGLFPEKYFTGKLVPALDMKIKKLMPVDAESRRMIDWMEKGVYDALQKKYLKTLLFCVCKELEGPMIEEYAFSFSYSNSNIEQVSMNVNRIGNKKNGTTFKCNPMNVTPDQMRSSACKMVRTLVQLMRTLDRMPRKRTILMKLLYYDDVTPADYEPPFFRCCSESEASSTWTKNPLEMEAGNVNSKHFALALKVKSVLDPCEDENYVAAEDEDDDDDDSDSEGCDMKQEVEMQDFSPPEKVNKSADEDYIYMKALYHALPMDYVTVTKLQKKLDGEANQGTVRKLIDKMAHDGYLKNSGNKRLGKRVVHSELTNQKLLEAKNMIEGQPMETETQGRKPFDFIPADFLPPSEHDVDGSTFGRPHSIGSDTTRTRVQSEAHQDASIQAQEQGNTPTSKTHLISSLESGMGKDAEGKGSVGGDGSHSLQDRRSRKSRMVNEPIPQRQKNVRLKIGEFVNDVHNKYRFHFVV